MTRQDQQQQTPTFAVRVCSRLGAGLFVAALFALVGLLVGQGQVDVLLAFTGVGFVSGLLLGSRAGELIYVFAGWQH